MLATHWTAEAEHGGFYQALADGLYEERGLNVTILPGGPMVNHRMKLAVGSVDFLIGSNLIQAFDALKAGVPSVVVAAFFQKDVHCLISHPGQGNDSWEDLKSAKLLIGNAGRQTYFRWLKAVHGFSEERVRPYTYTLAPFLIDKRCVQQGYLTAEPWAIAQAIGGPPNVFALSDHGWSTYSTLLETRQELVSRRPEVVQKFVEASVLGWVRYLYGDPSGAHRLIQRDNPEMEDALLNFSRGELIRRGVVDSGDALTDGIGALRSERVVGFYADMVQCGLYKQGQIEPEAAFTARFVNRGIGLDEKRRLSTPK
ncbi:MAG: ABC transporter substrate-binding protein [Planctomycetota bacterium]